MLPEVMLRTSSLLDVRNVTERMSDVKKCQDHKKVILMLYK